MQREPQGTTFRQIHGTKQAWFEAIETIIDTALVQADDNSPLRLRLLSPKETPASNAQTGVDFVLTRIGDISNTDYLTVSYCWAQPESIEVTQLPDYRIWNSQDAETSRPLRCPKQVFHRALQFARHKNCPFIWIDQECIDQLDKSDIENHLQIMHRVYEESAFTVIPLATDPFLPRDYIQVTTTNELDDEIVRADALRLLYKLREDKWWTRTWTYQERISASNAYLMIPQTCPQIPASFWVSEDSIVLPTNDLCLAMSSLQGLYQSILPCLPSVPVVAFTKQSVFREKIITGLKNPDDLHLVWFHDEMEKCDNEVTADRLAILGNSVLFPWRLLSDRLDRVDRSYSTCVFTLLWANRYPEKDARHKFYEGDTVLDQWFEHDIRHCLEHWQESGDNDGLVDESLRYYSNSMT